MRARPVRHAGLVAQTRQRVRGCSPHLRLVPVVLGGRPETSACSSPGEPTTSKPWRPRMFSSYQCSSEPPQGLVVVVGGGGGGTAAVTTDVSTVEPNEFVAVTCTRTVKFASVGWTM